ncbi:MAG: DUF2182 domain-containing protein [Actinobacteria bacterium]|nr:DUF2182 domain-containing protein [Actinomycetota bacterium]
MNFVGSVVPHKNGRGLLTSSVPPLDPGTYTLAYWCPGCATSSRGRTFFVQQSDQFVQPYRSQALLRINTTQSCPVTLPNANRPPGQPRNVSWYGNRLLWAGLVSDGIYAVPQDRVGADGSIGNKLLWVTTPPWRAAGTLVAAAVYELTPLKDVCLGKCRSPLGFLLGSWRDGVSGALQMGVRHGAWCVGCCWALMASLFALGVMSIAWMAFVAALIAAEKTLPWRRPVTYAIAATLIGLGIALIVGPDAIPGLTIPDNSGMVGMNP